MICPMPVYNPLARAARPKRCGKPASIITNVPYVNGFKFEKTCLPHSVETSVWRATQFLPKPVFTEEEKNFLIKHCGIEIMAEMKDVFAEENAARKLNTELNSEKEPSAKPNRTMTVIAKTPQSAIVDVQTE